MTASVSERRKRIDRVVRVSCGNFLEMYDFMVFGYYAAAIGAAFFPSGNPFASLMASLLSGTTPSGPYTIATYTGILSGTFTAAAGISVDYSTLGQIKMTINSLGTPGDYNGDTKINVADYVTWRKNPGGNGNDPGYVTWRENFNTSQSAGAGLSGAAVPEPATWMLALMVMVLPFRRANRK